MDISHETLDLVKVLAAASGEDEEEAVRRFREMWESLGADTRAAYIVMALWRGGFNAPEKVAFASLDDLACIKNLGSGVGRMRVRMYHSALRASLPGDVPRETKEEEEKSSMAIPVQPNPAEPGFDEWVRAAALQAAVALHTGENTRYAARNAMKTAEDFHRFIVDGTLPPPSR
jgi:hypothetical protein